MSAKEVDAILAKHGVKRTGKNTASTGAYSSGTGRTGATPPSASSSGQGSGAGQVKAILEKHWGEEKRAQRAAGSSRSETGRGTQRGGAGAREGKTAFSPAAALLDHPTPAEGRALLGVREKSRDTSAGAQTQQKGTAPTSLPTPRGRDEKETLRQESRLLAQLAKGVSPETLGAREELREQRLQNIPAAELKKRQEQAVGHLEQAKRALADRERETTPYAERGSTAAGGLPYAAGLSAGEETEEDKALYRELGKWQGIVNDLSNHYYYRENEEKATALAGDQAGQSRIQAVEDIRADLRTLGEVVAGEYGNLQRREELMAKYGLSERELETQATALIGRLQGELERAKEEAKAAGYDYDRMTLYQERKEQTARAIEGQRQTEEFAQEHPVWASGASILVSPLQGLDYAAQLAKGYGHSDTGKLESYVPANVYEMRATNFVRNVRGTVARDLEEKYGWSIGDQNMAAFLYQTGMSMGDFLFQAMLTGNFSGGLGGAGTQAAQKAASNLSLAIMGSGAAANTTAEAIERGLSNQQAFTLGAIAGVAEIITEKVSLETLLDRTALDKSAMGYLLKNIMAEGSEEIASDLINWAGDVLVSKDQSQWSQAIREYMAQGMGEKEAFQQALKDQLISMAWSGLGGGISGGVMAGGRIAIGGYQNRGTARGMEAQQGQKTASDGEAVRADTSLFDRAVLQNFNAARKWFIEYAKEKFPEQVVNVETGRTIGISRTGLDKFLSGNIPFEKYASGFHIPELIEQAHKVSEAANYHQSTAESIPTFEYFDSPIEIEGRIYNAHIRVKNTLIGDKYYGHTVSEIEDIKIEHPTRTSVPVQPAVQLENTGRSTSDIILPQEGEDVKEEFALARGEYAQGAQELTDEEQQAYRAAQIRDASQVLGRHGASIAQEFYQGMDQDPAEYFGGFSAYYQAGLTGQEMGRVQKRYSGALNEAQREAAYMAGQMDAAESLAREKEGARFAPVAGKEPGLVYDEFVKGAVKSGKRGEGNTYITKDTYRQLNALCKALGVRARMVDSVAGGMANADIAGSEIRIEKNNPNPIRALLGHELTHRIQQLSPTEYRFFRNYVGQLEGSQAAVEAMIDLYHKRGLELSYETALDEVAADYAGALFENSESLDRFIRENMENRSLLEKVRDFVREIVGKLTGKEKRQATEAERKLTAALEAAAAQAKTLTETESAATEGGEARYSLVGTTEDGTEIYETSDAIKKLPMKQRQAEFLRIMQDEYRGRTAKFTADNGEVYYAKFDEGDVRKNIYGDKRSDRAGYKAKINTGADGSIFELVENARHTGGKTEKGKSTPSHKNVSRWEYFVKTVQIDGKVYDLLANVRKKPDGEYVYSIQMNRNKNKAPAPPAAHAYGSREGTGYASKRVPTDASMDSISGSGEKSNSIFSLKGEEELLKETRALVKQARTEGWSDERLRQARMAAVEKVYEGLIKEYGAIPAGEKPAREIRAPRKTGDGEKVSQTVRTILEAKATPESAIPTIQELAAKGEFSYEAVTDKAAMERAESTITEKNWGRALADWKMSMAAGSVSKNNTALGWALYNNAANHGNLEVAMDILREMVHSQRSAAQALQATRILKQLSPEAQLYGVVQSVEGLQKELNERYGEKDAPELKISEELGKQLLEAQSQAEREAALKEIYRDIGRQMPSRFRDKWNAWRYLSMLGNPRTHVRNVVGNAGFAPVVAMKDLTATAIEKAVSVVSGGGLERSKGLVGLGKKGRALLSAAWGDYANVEEAALGGGKYSDLQNANKYIEEGRVIFKGKAGKALELARKANSRALDVEDVWFSRPHYAYAMAQFCKVHGITEAEIRRGNDKVLSAARSYAIKEAQKATYRDTNALSQTVGQLGRDRSNGKNPASKGLGILAEGILPFRKTPANILARGLEYSPLGLLKGLSYDLRQVQKGKMMGAEAIDNISAGLTGTGLLALGVYLAAQGLVRGRGGGDDKERELEELQGHQDYSLELPDGTSVTLDWLAPEALPFFVGVNLWEVAQKEEGNVNFSQVLEAVGNVSEPMLEMSCLQSLNDVLEAGSKVGSQGLGALPSAIASSATSYLTQGLPTLFGQLERTSEEERESTYTEKNAFLTPDMQYTLGKVSGKIPGWEYQQIPYIDAWGRHESSGGVGVRAFNNLLNPAFPSEVNELDVEKELLRLYEETGEEGVLPKRAAKYFNVDGQRRELTGPEYVRYAEEKGQLSLKLVTAMTESKLYESMEDGGKAEAVGDAYTYANQVAMNGIDSGAAMDSWVAKARQAEEKYQIPVSTYILLRNSTQDIGGLKDADGETIPNSRGLLIMQEIYSIKGLTDEQRQYLFEAFGVGKTVRHYNKAAVEEALGRMGA